LAPNATGPFTAILARDTNGVIHRVDVNAQAQAANGPSTKPQISGDGFSVIFQSDATNLVPDDTNGATDVFVGGSAGCCGLDRVSHPTFSSQANGASFDGSIGFDARFVAFASDATNLADNDTNGVTDVFGRDRRGNGPTVALSFTLNPTFTMGNGASTMPQISSDGHFVSFRSLATNFDPTDTNGVADIYLGIIGGGTAPTRVSLTSSGAQANGTSFQSTVSTNGKAIAFVSSATNLVANDTNGFPDVFVHDQTTGQTIRIQRDASTQPNGSPLVNSSMRFSGNPTSPGFSFLAFDSQATNMVFSDTNQVADVFTASLSP
jgi:TolB protein